MPTYGSNQDRSATLTMSPLEHDEFKKGELVQKVTGSAHGEFRIGMFMVREPLRAPLTSEQVTAAVNDRIQFNIMMSVGKLACMGEDMDGLNDHIDDRYFTDVPSVPCDLKYRAVGVLNGQVIIEVDCDVSDVLQALSDEADGNEPRDEDEEE